MTALISRLGLSPGSAWPVDAATADRIDLARCGAGDSAVTGFGAGADFAAAFFVARFGIQPVRPKNLAIVVGRRNSSFNQEGAFDAISLIVVGHAKRVPCDMPVMA